MKNEERRRLFDAVVWTASAMFTVMLMVHEAHAGEHRFPLGEPAYVNECGSCHIAYPAQLMSAASWTKLMKNLDQHFGTDASVDARSADLISTWLGSNAGMSSRVGTESIRISGTPWFSREHREVAAKFSRPAVKSAANCGACHRGAAQGNYSEHGVVLPK